MLPLSCLASAASPAMISLEPHFCEQQHQLQGGTCQKYLHEPDFID